MRITNDDINSNTQNLQFTNIEDNDYNVNSKGNSLAEMEVRVVTTESFSLH